MGTSKLTTHEMKKMRADGVAVNIIAAISGLALSTVYSRFWSDEQIARRRAYMKEYRRSPSGRLSAKMTSKMPKTKKRVKEYSKSGSGRIGNRLRSKHNYHKHRGYVFNNCLYCGTLAKADLYRMFRQEGWSYQRIADRFNIQVANVYMLLRAGEHDKRRKLTDDQKKEIIKLYNSGQWTIANLAEEYGVSKATIGFTVKPESRRPHKRSYYDTEKNTERKRRYRQRLRELRDTGEL